ncbi:MAG: tRNA (N(6)-L-threonylcarbamoyladenosine(37)-C(2))-methylthiotransferase MtaB [Candidatus Cloacimonetes bacterium]|nr:tRNA (N(6)-L-threonylcarbamoyladenosine(37)-C(2))-methylthiotransferase MtaB [Candidatus Cloacimonadota bacterium]
MKRIAIATLGCKTNAYESAAIAAGFEQEKVQLVPFNSEADIYVINTCTVTGRTDFKSRNLIRKALAHKEKDPRVKVVVTGCFAQRVPHEIRELGDIDLIADNQNKADIAVLLEDADYVFQDIMACENYHHRPVKGMLERSRAFQKIQDGCDFRCAYCAVPLGRGNSRSASYEDVVGQARIFAQNGYREIVLGGVNLGLYKDGNRNLADVVEALQEIDGLEFIRLSSIEPELFHPDILRRVSRCEKLCPHFHIPLQSGSDSVLKRMGRSYDVAAFQNLIHRILQSFPNAAIGLDVIAGFPGESEAEFEATLRLLESLELAYLHAFTFSRRPGTAAFSLPGQISNHEKNRRVNLLTELSEQKKQGYIQKLVQKRIELRAVCETLSDGLASGLSDHYIRVFSPATVAPGELIRGRALQTQDEGILLEPGSL